MSVDMQFSTVVRNRGGAARKFILNLPVEDQTPACAFEELPAQFGEMSTFGDPLADFYERMRHNKETPSIYAIELEATLCTIEERMNDSHPLPKRDSMLTQQFMRGVAEEKVTSRLAPMKPREMTLRELQIELLQIEQEHRTVAALHQTKTTATSHATTAQSQPQYTSPSPHFQKKPSEVSSPSPTKPKQPTRDEALEERCAQHHHYQRSPSDSSHRIFAC